MTEKQKGAIKVLNDLRHKSHITESEYFDLMDFVVEAQQQISYIPFNPINPNPFPITYETSCNSK